MAGIQIKFSVPEFPAFRNSLTLHDEQRYRAHLDRFVIYATTAIAAQSKVAAACIENGGFQSQKVEIENMVNDVKDTLESLAVKSSLYVADEIKEAMSGFRKQLDDGVKELSTVETVVVAQSEEVVVESAKRGVHYARNLRRRQKRAAGLHEKVPVQEGFWNSCSEEVRAQLIESKAKRHIAENLFREKESMHKIGVMDQPKAPAVGGWAETVKSGSASMPPTAPNSIPSVNSISSASSNRFSRSTFSKAERYVVSSGLMTALQVNGARMVIGRPLRGIDFVEGYGSRFSDVQRRALLSVDS